ncbi:MAG: hypothetical protein KGI71_06430 [Patescibacteria group bacterium]|nr:hypothetical protein [Patescibacteria group bacterium]
MNRRSKLGTKLTRQEQNVVVSRMKPSDVDTRTWLAQTRFYVTQDGTLDMRSRRPAGRVLSRNARVELSQVRQQVRQLVKHLQALH